MANTRITRNISSGSTTNKFTLSFWIKKSATHTNDEWLFENYNSGSARTWVRFNLDTGNPRLEVSEYTGSYIFRKITNRVFRDIGAFYHIHIQFDSTQGTEANRLKIYINGVQETSFAQTNHPSLNATSIIGNTGNQYLGYSENIGGAYFSGIMSHAHFCHGYSYSADSFGSTDSTTGEWKINTSPSVTYGALGWFWLKDTNATTDSSPNSNTFTVGSGTLTKTEDCPSNVFATWNPLNPTNPDFANGNATLTRASNSWKSAWTTIGASSGKYYCEIDWDSGSNFTLGFSTVDVPSSNPTLGDLVGNPSNGGYITVLYENGIIYNNGSNAGAYGSGSTYTTNDIMMLAMDLDNNKFYFGKNGTWFNSANPANNTGGYDINASYTNSTWCFSAVVYGTGSWHGNFGNGYFGTTAVSSAGTNASGNGIFEHDCPAGFTALSTKGLNL